MSHYLVELFDAVPHISRTQLMLAGTAQLIVIALAVYGFIHLVGVI